MEQEEVIEYLYDPTEGIDDDDVNLLMKVYIEPVQKQVETPDIDEEKGKMQCELQCQYCGRSFKRRNGLVLHLRTHLNELEESGATMKTKSLTCSECSQQFNSRRSLSIHVQSHSAAAAGEFTCDECGKSFARAHLLSAHHRTHTDECAKPYLCPLCSSCFVQRSLLEDHVRLEHVDDGDVFRCVACGELYSESESAGLTDHICTSSPLRQRRQRRQTRLKSGSKQHACKHCGRTFGSVSNLSSHMRTHTGTRICL